MTKSGRVLVTGGAGFIGGHLVEFLLRSGRQVRVLDDFSSGSLANLEDARRLGPVDLITGSVLDMAMAEQAVAGCESVFHLAVQCVRRSIGRPLENHAVNATGSLNMLEAARRAGVRRFVYVSSSEVYGNGRDTLLDEERTVCEPVTVYGGAKLVGEYYTKAYHATYGLPVVVVRPFNAYGPREHMHGDLAEVIPRFVIRVRNGLPPIIFGTGENGRDFTFVTEVAQGIARVEGADGLVGKVVNLAYGRMVTISEVAHTVAAACGRPDLQPIHVDPRPGDVFRLHANTGRARAELGFEAKIEFSKGIGMYVDWFDRTQCDPAALLEDAVQNWTLPPA
jgi:UDP-glucose 4-epimerase